MSYSQPAVSVVIPTCGRSARCRRLLTAIAAQDLGPDEFEVIVVDDASDDDTGEMLDTVGSALPFRLRSARLDVNSGPAVARNLGWRMADAEVVAFVDDDCVPEATWLTAGLAAMADPEVGVVQGRTVPPAEYHTVPQPRWHHIQDLSTTSPYFEGCNIFYRKPALEATGGFHEGINWWGEDTALGWEVLERGWKRGDGTGAVVVHDVTNRGWLWYLNAAWLERNLVGLASVYPDFRRSAFWRPWAFQPRGPATALAVVALALSTRRPAALVGVVPYVLMSRSKPRGPRSLVHFVEEAGVECARLAGHLVGSVENGILVI